MIGYTNVLTTASDFRPELKWQRAEPYYMDLGYSLPLPWPQTTTAGFWNAGTIPEVKALITRDDPEWFAVSDTIRTTGGIPEIDVNDPVYQFQRSDYTFPVSNKGFELV